MSGLVKIIILNNVFFVCVLQCFRDFVAMELWKQMKLGGWGYCKKQHFLLFFQISL